MAVFDDGDDNNGVINVFRMQRRQEPSRNENTARLRVQTMTGIMTTNTARCARVGDKGATYMMSDYSVTDQKLVIPYYCMTTICKKK